MARLLPLCALAVFACAAPAHADRWFGSISVSCDSFADCLVSPDMPEPPADPASFRLERSGKANTPVKIFMRVNKPVEGGVPIRLAFGDTVFELQPGTDVLTERRTHDGKAYLAGYQLAGGRVAEVLAAIRRVDSGRMKLAVAGQPQERVIRLDGLEAALRYLDERQGRAGAQDALIDKGPREAADAAAPKALPAKEAWPKEIARIFRREKCADRLHTFDELETGFIATPAPGREMWGIACDGGNYNVNFILIDVRNGDIRTARAMNLPIRSRKRSLGAAINPVWWDARKELWAFLRGHSHGACGTVAQYRWTASGFKLVNERRKDDCDGKFDDPWARWPEVTSSSRTKR